MLKIKHLVVFFQFVKKGALGRSILHYVNSAARLELVNAVNVKENSSAVKDRSNAEEAKCDLRKINFCFF